MRSTPMTLTSLAAASLLLLSLPARADDPPRTEAERVAQAQQEIEQKLQALRTTMAKLADELAGMKSEQEQRTMDAAAVDARRAERDLAAVESIRQQQQKALERTQAAAARRASAKEADDSAMGDSAKGDPAEKTAAEAAKAAEDL